MIEGVLAVPNFLSPHIGFSAVLGIVFTVLFAAFCFVMSRVISRGDTGVPGQLRNLCEGLVQWLDSFAVKLNKWLDKHEDAPARGLFDIGEEDPAVLAKARIAEKKRWNYRAVGLFIVYAAGVLMFELFGGFYLPALGRVLNAYTTLVGGRMAHIHLNIDPVPYTFFGFDIGMSAVIGFVLVALLALLAFIASRKAKKFEDVPSSTLQVVLEYVIDFVEGLCGEKLGHYAKGVAPYIMAIGAYILFGCLIELFAVTPIAMDLNMPIAISVMTFVLINFMCIRYKGISGRLKYYVTPMPFIAPIRLITDLAIPVSLSCRLFGNIVSGFILMDLIYMVADIFVPAVLSIYFTLFHSAIQTYIFCMLTLSFIGETLE